MASPATIRFIPRGVLEDREAGVGYCGVVFCVGCGNGPVDVTAPAGVWTPGYCPVCGTEHLIQPIVGKEAA